jgi:long-chain acyl-CoA synthetase
MSLGIEHSDRMGLLATNRPEWFIADLACMSVGGTTAPVYATSSPQQVAHVLGHSGCKIAVAEDLEQLEKIMAVRAELPKLEHVIVMAGVEHSEQEGFTMSWQAFLQRAERVAQIDFERAAAGVDADDVATFVYTSGTTGSPKAVMLTHSNIWWTCESLEQHLLIANAADGRALSYLPLSHIAERMVSHFLQILFGSETWFARSPGTLLDDLRACRPTYLFGVPRVWEKFHAALRARLEERDGLRARIEGALLRRALAVGRLVTEAEQAAVHRGKRMSDARLGTRLRLQHALFERVVLRTARARVGLGACARAFSAAAPLDPEIVRTFHALGLRIAEGYGQSETNGPTTWNRPDAIKIGTVGTAIPGLRVALAEDGEVLVRGGNVTPGYFEDEPATADLIDGDGWLHSGDIGKIDEQGYLTITERKKDLIVTSGGKNVAPQEIENRLRLCDIVSQVVVIGDRRPFLTALVTLDEPGAVTWARDRGISGDVAAIAHHERTLQEIAAAVDELNRSVAQAESIKKFRVLERDLCQEHDEMTPTLKVKRRRIDEVYAEVIEEMYRRDSPAAAGARGADA